MEISVLFRKPNECERRLKRAACGRRKAQRYVWNLPGLEPVNRSVTIWLDESTIEYFRALAAELKLPHQRLINLSLRDCAASRRRLSTLVCPPASARTAFRQFENASVLPLWSSPTAVSQRFAAAGMDRGQP